MDADRTPPLQRLQRFSLPLQQEELTIDQPLLEAYLQQPQRVLQDLLQSSKLRPIDATDFRYTPRPIQLAGFKLRPRVSLRAEWQAPTLRINLVRYRLKGLEALEARIHYSFEAEMLATDTGLELSAIAALALGEADLTPLLPPSVFRFLGDRFLRLILERLKQRCLRNLPTAITQWVALQGCQTVGGSCPPDVQCT